MLETNAPAVPAYVCCTAKPSSSAGCGPRWALMQAVSSLQSQRAAARKSRSRGQRWGCQRPQAARKQGHGVELKVGTGAEEESVGSWKAARPLLVSKDALTSQMDTGSPPCFTTTETAWMGACSVRKRSRCAQGTRTKGALPRRRAHRSGQRHCRSSGTLARDWVRKTFPAGSGARSTARPRYQRLMEGGGGAPGEALGKPRGSA